MALDLTGKSIGNDKDAIFVFKVILTDGTVLKLAETAITLSSNPYTSDFFNHDTLTDMSKIIDGVDNGGGVGGVGNCSIRIPRDSSNANSSSYIDSFYPSTGQPHIDSSIIKVGLVWVGNTLESQILWLHEYYVEDVKTTYDEMKLSLIETSEMESIQLPRYKIHRESTKDEGISYFPKAPSDSNGRVIPLIYGDFNEPWDFDSVMTKEGTGYAPMILVDTNDNEFVMCSHKVETVGQEGLSETPGVGINQEVIYRYEENLDMYFRVYHLDTATVPNRGVSNTNAKYTMTFGGGFSFDDRIVTHIFVPLRTRGGVGNVTDVSGVTDEYTTSGTSVAPGETLSLKAASKIDNETVGEPTNTSADVKLICSFVTGGGNVDWKLNHHNLLKSPQINGASGSGSGSGATYVTYSIGSTTIFGSDNIDNMQDFCELDFSFENKVSSVDSANVQHLMLEFINSNLNQVTYKKIRIAIAGRAAAQIPD